MKAVFVSVGALLALGAAGSEPPSFVVAIVRTDGRLVPFAAWNGAAWERAWPAAGEAIPARIDVETGLPAPTDVDAVPSVWSRRAAPVPRTWSVRPAAGGRPIRTRVRGAEIVVAHCGGQVALATDLPDPTADDDGMFRLGLEGRFGVAVAGSAPTIAIEHVSRASPSWKEARQVVRAGFDAREKAKAEASRRELPRYRPTPPVRLLTLRGQAGAPNAPLYFESERSYPTGPFFADRTCPTKTLMSGWLVRSAAGALTLLDPKVFVTDCDGKEVNTLFPLGAVRAGTRSFWVMQEHGWEDESFVLLDVGPSHVKQVMKVEGGGC